LEGRPIDLVSDRGGEHALKGFEFQIHSLIFYFLRRCIDHDDLSIELETREDGMIVYPGNSESEPFSELIQCKKKEKRDSGVLVPGYGTNALSLGHFSLTDIIGWVQKKRKDNTAVADLLVQSENLAYTALLLSDATDALNRLAPVAVDSQSTAPLWFRTNFESMFPFDFVHAEDPVKAKKKATHPGSAEVRKKIRALVLPPTSTLRLQSERLLRESYQIPPSHSSQAISELVERVLTCAMSSEVGEKTFTRADLIAFLEPFKPLQSKWTRTSQWLSRQSNRPAAVDLGEPLGWHDFEQGRYVDLSLFDDAARAFDEDGFVHIHGFIGCGKTTLARSLAYRALSRGMEGYVLTVHPRLRVAEEIAFLTANLSKPVVFVIDGAQLAKDAVRELLSVYHYGRNERHVSCKLIVTSTETVNRKMLGTAVNQNNPLAYATAIRFTAIPSEQFETILELVGDRFSLDVPFPKKTIARLSGNRIGQAMMLLRAASNLGDDASVVALFEDTKIHKLLETWVLEKTEAESSGELKHADNRFYGVFVPILDVTSVGLSVDRQYHEGVIPLERAGFLRPIDAADPQSELISDKSFNIIFLRVRRARKPRSRVTAFAEYLDHHPTRLPELCAALANSKSDREVLEHLVADEKHFTKILQILVDRRAVLPLGQIIAVLSHIHTASRPYARSLFRKMAAPNGEITEDFFDRYFTHERIENARSLTSAFKVLLEIDRELLRRLAHVMKQKHLDALAGVVISEDAPLSEVGATIASVSRFSRQIGEAFFAWLRGKTTFPDQLAAAEKNNSRLGELLQFCISLKWFQRSAVANILERVFTPQHLVSHYLRASDKMTALVVLHQLKRLRPRVTNEVTRLLWQEHQTKLTDQSDLQSSFVGYTRHLAFLARLNRRVARSVAENTVSRVALLIGEVHQHKDIASELDVLERAVGWSFANALTVEIDREAILESLRQESHQFNLVGKNLAVLARVDADLGAWLEARLNCETFIANVSEMYLYNHVSLISGFLQACDHDRYQERLQAFTSSRLVSSSLARAWRGEQKMSQICYGIGQLLGAGLSRTQVRDIFGFRTWSELEKDLVGRFGDEASLLRFAHGLYLVADFLPEAADRALTEYVNKALKPASKKEEPRGIQPYRRQEHQKYGYRDETSNNLTDQGALLRISAAINPEAALALARATPPENLVETVLRETNLGRLAVFLSGLHAASRSACLELLEKLESQRIKTRQKERPLWEHLLYENENPRNILYFGRVLSRISQSRGRHYAGLLIDTLGAEIGDFAEYEGNVLENAHWLRLNARVTGETDPQLVSSLQVASDFDARLEHLLEGVEALWLCGQVAESREFAELALNQRRQLASVTRLRDLMKTVQKAQHVEHLLDLDGFTDQLLEPLEPSRLRAIMIGETSDSRHALLSAFAVHLIGFDARGRFLRYTPVISSVRDDLLNRVANERKPLFRCLIETLCEGTGELSQREASNPEWQDLWERGLCSVVAEMVDPQFDLAFDQCLELKPDWQEKRPLELTPDASNIEFGLSFRLIERHLEGELARTLEEQRRLRAEDSSVAAATWLLNGENDEREHWNWYVWTILRETVLRRNYLMWQHNIDVLARRDAFNEKTILDLQII